MTMTKDQIKQAVADKIVGQGNQVDISGALGNILIDTVDNIPEAQVQSDWNQADDTKADYIKNKPSIPTVPTAAQTLASLTLTSSATSFTDGSDLSKADAATALGVTEAELDALMAGSYLRLVYNTDKVLGVDAADGANLSLGAAYLKVTLAEDKYAIDVA